MAITVAYPGRDGAHSAAACDRLFPDGAELVGLPSFSAVAAAATDRSVEFGVLPIESSLSGPVAETHDLLFDSPLAITAETVISIRHCLVALGEVPREEIRVLHSHPTALDQCRQLVASMPWATVVASATTADAAAHVAEHGDPTEAAIASERAAKLQGLTVLEESVGDHDEAYTRFVSIATHVRLDRRLDRDESRWHTAFSFVTNHEPGALHLAIEPFARHRIDLVQLVSRPLPKTPWRYRFDAVLEGHPLDADVRDALTEVRSGTRRLAVFGSYPADGAR